MKSKISIGLCCFCCAMFLLSACSEDGESQNPTDYLTWYFDYFEVESVEYYPKGWGEQPDVKYVTAQDPADVDRILRYFMSFPHDTGSQEHYLGSNGTVEIKGVNGERAIINVQGNDISEMILDADGVFLKDADGRYLDGSIWYQGDDWDDVHVLWDIYELFGFERPETE